MPAKNHLTSEQKEKLQKALKREENAHGVTRDWKANITKAFSLFDSLKIDTY